VEFSDYQCPFCDRYTADTLPQITSKYIDTGKVKYYFRDYPLGFHPQAKPAAIAASCAGAQGKYWEMHDLLFAKQGEWSGSAEVDQLLATYAADLGLNIEDFEKCSADSSIADEIDEDFAAGAKLGVSGTPSFFINGVKIVGAQPYATFEAAIEKALEN
ncbi:MAG: DsbA family protein, partial [bacterium]